MFMVQLSAVCIHLFKYLLRKKFYVISLLTVRVPAATADPLGRLWAVVSLCCMSDQETCVVKVLRLWSISSVQSRVLATQDTEVQPLP